MDLLRFFRYQNLMRIWLTVLLVALFAVVHSAAAFTPAQADSFAPESAVEADAGHHVSSAAVSAIMHHGKCCEQSGETKAHSKDMHCSIDCTSYFVDTVSNVFQAKARREGTDLAAYSARQPEVNNRPPRRS